MLSGSVRVNYGTAMEEPPEVITGPDKEPDSLWTNSSTSEAQLAYLACRADWFFKHPVSLSLRTGLMIKAS